MEEKQILINITESKDRFIFLINSTISEKVALNVKSEKEQEFINALEELIRNYNAE